MKTDKKKIFFKIIQNKKLFIGGIMIVIIVSLISLAPHIAPYDYKTISTGERLELPSKEHLFGTDHLGRDIFSRVLYGGRYSFIIAIFVVIGSNCLGTTMGLISGYLGGKYDLLIMRIADIVFTLPYIIIAALVTLIAKRSMFTVILALSIIYFPSFARISRGSTLSVKETNYVKSGVISGETTPTILIKYILPNISGPIIVQSAMTLAYAVLIEAILSYLGYGLAPPIPSWGLILQDATKYYIVNPYIVIFPGLAIVITVLSFSFFGDGLRDFLDPKFVPIL